VGLDWFTLIAQVVNFLVLVWLLEHFLYGRIVRAMNEREAKISGRLEEAAHQRATAEQEAELFRTRNRELEERRDQMLAQAQEEAESHRQQLMEAARLETEAAQVQWLEALERERQGLLQDFRERLGQQVFALARHGLKELANADLEEQILKVFVERLQTLDPAEREALVAAVRDTDREVEIRTAFPVLSEAREGLSRSLREQLDDRVDVRFTAVPELICGIELRAHSHRFAWNLDSYLEGLEARVFEVLEESAKKHAKPR
jgi:F-type H+-transporting ATPase subunit b